MKKNDKKGNITASLPIDQIENSKRVLVSGNYQIPLSRGIEDKWLMRYLIDVGKSPQEIREIWEPIYLSRQFNRDFINSIDRTFDTYLRYAQGHKNRTFNKIVIYEEELEKIRKSDLLPWLKEFALEGLSFFKAIGKTAVALKDFPKTKLIGETSCYRYNSDINIFGRLQRNGLFTLTTPSGFNTEYGIEEEKQLVKCFFLKNKGTAVFEADSILDIGGAFYLLRPICPVCGKPFEVTSKTKRDICFDCWRKKETQRKKTWKKRLKAQG